MSERSVVHRRRSAKDTSRDRAELDELDEQLAIKSGHHFRTRLSREVHPHYALDLAGAEQLQAETLAWVRTWPLEPIEGATLCRAGSRAWVERWDGGRWVEVEGSSVTIDL
jgi:hypothetical protein